VLSESQDTAAARADLFQDKIFCLAAGSKTPADALQMATDLIEALGALPFFIDPLEHDGLAAAVEHLPMILAAALALAASESRSWQEMRKLAANQFYTSSYLVETDPGAAAEDCLTNRDNTIRWIDNLMAELGRWRQRLEANDQEGLTEKFSVSMAATRQWLTAQATGRWEEGPAMELPSAGSQMRRMFGFGGRDFRSPPKGKGR